MKLGLRNSVSILVAMILLISTSGFTVFKHHCNTQNISQFSFIIEDFNCGHNDYDHEHIAPSCCAESHANADRACEGGNCCDTESYVVKLDITIDIQKVLKHSIPLIGLAEAANPIEVPTLSKDSKHILIHNDLPPPLSGKALHIYLQQLKLDCFSV